MAADVNVLNNLNNFGKNVQQLKYGILKQLHQVTF
jgi:hypothetical protein